MLLFQKTLSYGSDESSHKKVPDHTLLERREETVLVKLLFPIMTAPAGELLRRCNVTVRNTFFKSMLFSAMRLSLLAMDKYECREYPFFKGKQRTSRMTRHAAYANHQPGRAFSQQQGSVSNFVT